MTTLKAFDCVEYKRAIQERHIAETQGLKPEQKTLRRQQWLKQSDNPAAQLWREMALKQMEDLHDLAVVAERREEKSISLEAMKRRT